MADTLPNIELTDNEWVDLYAASGIVVGTKIVVQNLGVPAVYLSTSATSPDDTDAFQILQFGIEAANEAGDSGAWAMCLNSNGLVNVREA